MSDGFVVSLVFLAILLGILGMFTSSLFSWGRSRLSSLLVEHGIRAPMWLLGGSQRAALLRGAMAGSRGEVQRAGALLVLDGAGEEGERLELSYDDEVVTWHGKLDSEAEVRYLCVGLRVRHRMDVSHEVLMRFSRSFGVYEDAEGVALGYGSALVWRSMVEVEHVGSGGSMLWPLGTVASFFWDESAARALLRCSPGGEVLPMARTGMWVGEREMGWVYEWASDQLTKQSEMAQGVLLAQEDARAWRAAWRSQTTQELVNALFWREGVEVLDDVGAFALWLVFQREALAQAEVLQGVRWIRAASPSDAQVQQLVHEAPDAVLEALTAEELVIWVPEPLTPRWLATLERRVERRFELWSDRGQPRARRMTLLGVWWRGGVERDLELWRVMEASESALWIDVLALALDCEDHPMWSSDVQRVVAVIQERLPKLTASQHVALLRIVTSRPHGAAGVLALRAGVLAIYEAQIGEEVADIVIDFEMRLMMYRDGLAPKVDMKTQASKLFAAAGSDMEFWRLLEVVKGQAQESHVLLGMWFELWSVLPYRLQQQREVVNRYYAVLELFARWVSQGEVEVDEESVRRVARVVLEDVAVDHERRALSLPWERAWRAYDERVERRGVQAEDVSLCTELMAVASRGERARLVERRDRWLGVLKARSESGALTLAEEDGLRGALTSSGVE